MKKINPQSRVSVKPEKWETVMNARHSRSPGVLGAGPWHQPVQTETQPLGHSETRRRPGPSGPAPRVYGGTSSPPRPTFQQQEDAPCGEASGGGGEAACVLATGGV